MKAKLFGSFLLVSLFWWIALAFIWTVSHPAENALVLNRMASWWPVGNLPEMPVADDPSVLESLEIQLKVAAYWVLPVLALAGLSGALGAGSVWLWAISQARGRQERESAKGAYRGLSITLGTLPTPRPLPADSVEVSAEQGAELDKLFTPAQKRLLVDLLGIISAHPQAYSVEGGAVTLTEHTLLAVEHALQSRRHPALSALVAAAHEVGKITSWRKLKDGSWERRRSQEREAARILGTLDSWWTLPPVEREALQFAVLYRMNAQLLPVESGGLREEALKLAVDLIGEARVANAKAIVSTQQKVLDKTDLPEAVLQVFLDTLPRLPLRTTYTRRGEKTAGVVVGRRVYLLEKDLKDHLEANLTPELKAMLPVARMHRKGSERFAVTLELMKAFDKRGWLVKEANGVKLPTHKATWAATFGTVEFTNVIICDLPQDVRERLPGDATTTVVIKGPADKSSEPAETSAQDLVSTGLLRPKAAAARPAPVVPPDE